MATEVDRLVVVFDANFAALTEKLNKVLQKQEQAKKQIEATWNGKGLTGAAEKGFESLTERIGEAAKSLPVFGAALGALGPVGLAATVAVGGFVAVMEQTEKAVEYAAGIGKLATVLGTTTDFVQEFNFALKQSEIDIGAGDAALKSLLAVIGSVQGNLPRAKQLAVVFSQALHITPDQLRGYHDVADLFPVIAEAVKNAGSAMEQAAIAKKFGMEELLPLLKKGKDGINELEQAAQSLGVIIPQEQIEHAEEFKKKLNELTQVLDAQRTQTFVEYANTLVTIKEKWQEIERAALHYLASITGTQTLEQRIRDDEKAIAKHGMNVPGTTIFTAGMVTRAAEEDLAKAQRELALKQGKEAWDKAHEEEPGAAPQLVATKTPKEKHPPKDETLAFDKSAMDAYQHSVRDLAQAQADLTDNLTDRGELEKQAVEAERAAKVGDLKIEEAKIAAAVIDTHRDAQTKELEAARVNAERTAVAKTILIDERTLQGYLDRNIADEQAAADLRATGLKADADHLTALAALADTAQERASYETRALAKTQEADRVAADIRVRTARQEVDYLDQMGVQGDALDKAQRDLAAAIQDRTIIITKQADAGVSLARQNENPVQVYERSIQDLNTTMMEAGVSAAKSLADGLAEAIVNAKSLGDVATNVFKQIATEIASALIQKNVTGPILQALALTGFASGTSYAPGGLAVVGERGPELVNLPAGAQVIPNSALRSVGIGGATVVAPTIVFDNRGAVIWEQAARSMMAYADRAAMNSGSMAIQVSRRATTNDLTRSGAQRLGS